MGPSIGGDEKLAMFRQQVNYFYVSLIRIGHDLLILK